jgi:hypothetical protein
MPTLTRRTLLQSSSLVALAAAASAATGFLGGRQPRSLLQVPRTVPPDFLGMHFHRWPQGVPLSPAPTYSYGGARSHDYSGSGAGISWAAIHTADGVYDWSAMDPWVTTHQASSHMLIYTVYGTPAWLATSTTHQDAYGHPGGGYPPRALAPLAEFIGTLIRRYKGAIRFVEIWNEPHFVHNYATFWWGTAMELAAMGRTIYQAAKTADPTIRILAPGFDDNLTAALTLRDPTLAACQASSLYQYLAAPDSAGGRGGDWCDAIAFHTYEAQIDTATTGIEGQLLLLRTMLGLMRLSLPIYCTECGFRPHSTFAQSTVTQQAVTLRRIAAVLAASGVQGLYYYAHDDDFIGNPSRHLELASTLDTIQTRLAGAELHQVTVLPGGDLHIETDAETFLW